MTLASDLDLILIYDAPADARDVGRRAAAAGRRLLCPAEPAADRRDHRADRRGPALRGRHAAAAFGRVRADRLEPRRLRALPARIGLDLGAYGADPGAPGGRRRGRCARRIAAAIDGGAARAARPGPLLVDVADMRRRIADEHPRPSPWDLQQPARRPGRSRIHRPIPDAARGGARRRRCCGAAPPTALAALGEAGVLPPQAVRELADALALLRHVQALPDPARSTGRPSRTRCAEPDGATLARCAGAVDFARLDADITAACARVRGWYERLVAEPARQRRRNRAAKTGGERAR